MLILTLGQLLQAQENKTIGLSLQDCMKMAVEKNINVRVAQIDKEKSQAKKDESVAALLPKINMNGSFQDNLSIASTMIPGAFVGKPGTEIAMQMGSQYSAIASLGISEVLFDRTTWLALKISKKSVVMNSLAVEKAGEEIAADAARLYFLALTTIEQQKLVEGNIERAEKLKKITQVTLDNGTGVQVDLDRVSVNLENYYTQLSNSKAMLEQQLNMMKYILNISQQQNIVLTEKADMKLLVAEPASTTDFSTHVDIKLLESQLEINLLNQKKTSSEYLPTLNFQGLYAYQGLKSEFNDYFASNSAWYPYSYMTINLKIPIFDGFAKHSKSRQATLEQQKTQEKLDATKESFSMNYRNALNNYMNYKSNAIRQQQNLKLAEKVYDLTSQKYSQGLAPMTSLLQDETSMSNAQSQFLTALDNLREAEVKILSINGGIKNMIN